MTVWDVGTLAWQAAVLLLLWVALGRLRSALFILAVLCQVLVGMTAKGRRDEEEAGKWPGDGSAW